MNPHSFTNTHKSTHVHTAALTNMCKAKMLLTALNKLLNHLRQAEGSERSERASGEEEAISLAGKMP